MYIIDRPILLDEIRKSIIKNSNTNIYGLPGAGKTTLCQECINKYFKNMRVRIIKQHNYDYLILAGKSRYDIYIFEDFDENYFSEINYLEIYGDLDTKCIFLSREKLKNIINTGFIEVPFFSRTEVGAYLMMNLYYTELIDIYHRKIFDETKGNPSLVKEITDILNDRCLYDADDIDIINKPCILDSFGNPIDKSNKMMPIVVSEINDQFLYELSQKPNLLYNLSSYDFERVIAKMFEKKGFSVKITPQTRDGGKDIFIAKNDLCSFLFYVECKKYAPSNPVGIGVIQRLYGVVSAEKATGGIIATTSYFAKPAKDYVQEQKLEHKLTLQDYDTISNILKSLQHNTK